METTTPVLRGFTLTYTESRSRTMILKRKHFVYADIFQMSIFRLLVYFVLICFCFLCSNIRLTISGKNHKEPTLPAVLSRNTIATTG